MAGGSSSSSSHSAASAASASSAANGRERAIEALMDREPQGDYYRAARVVDDVVPMANSSRSNLITKAALVDQAFGLSVHAIDTLAQYDAHLRSDPVAPLAYCGRSNIHKDPVRTVDTLTKERILHYQTKLTTDKAGGATAGTTTVTTAAATPPPPPPPPPSTATSTTTDVPNVSLHITTAASGGDGSKSHGNSSNNHTSVTPPARLVAALRHVYEEPPAAASSPVSSLESAMEQKLKIETSNVLFELRQLLEAVSNHSVFHGSSSGSGSSVAVEDTGAKSAQANLEKLILNVTKQDTSADDSDTVLQGLLISILSVLTTTGASQPPPSSGKGSVADTLLQRAKLGRAKEESSPDDHEHEDMPFQSVLQVGALLSLLPLEPASTRRSSSGSDDHGLEDNDDDITALSPLDPSLLEYFGNAAAVYEERLEIQKARLLARMKTPTATPSQTPDDNKNDDTVNPSTDDPVTPVVMAEDPSGRHAESLSDQGGGGNNYTVEEVTADDLASIAVVELLVEQETERLSQALVHDADDDNGNDSGEEEMDIEDNADDIDDDDDDDSSDSSDDEGISAEEDEQYESQSDDMADDAVSAPDDDDGQPDEDHGEGSSSSDSEYTGESDGILAAAEEAMNTDEEDENILRQAMALSIDDPDPGDEASDTAPGGTESSADGMAAHSMSDDIDSARMTEDAVLTENPISPSSEVQALSFEDLEDLDLPALPKAPASHPFLNFSTTAVDPDAVTSSSTLPAIFDPSSLSEFASIPTTHVLFHLLRYSEAFVERKLAASSSSTCSGPSIVAGGMGAAMFASQEQRKDSAATIPLGGKKCSNSTLQMLVASLLLTMEQRNDAIENLRKAVDRQRQAVHEGISGDDDEDVADDDDSARPPVSGEADDPALTLAMNYVEDDVPLSSDSLENKGMRRKAAAAAHDAAALLKSLQKRTDAWKKEVTLYSSCVACAMKLVRQFLQSAVRASLADRNGLLVTDFHAYLPSFVISKLVSTLRALMAIDVQESLLNILGESNADFEKLFRSFALYKESLCLWAECVPLTHPTEHARAELIRLMVERCTSTTPSKSSVLVVEATNDAFKFPLSALESYVHKLQIVCRRLRIHDLLDGFVSRPVPFLSDNRDESSDNGDGSINFLTVPEPCLGSSLISVFGKTIPSLIGARREVTELYLALCHRCHTNSLLLDGFYATTETEADDRRTSSGGKALATGDTIRVSSDASMKLQFDATKCSDSIALVSGFGGSSSSDGRGSVNQRASKVWGAVLSTHQYSPKTGVHRWAIRLDKCERGHVFIGVATAQASTRTYVGGDKHGWGMIGTQALWHDRRKIRGDYGSTFRTGSTIIVTLDSDAGTLSFSSWNDNSTSSSFSLDPLVQNIVTPRRSGLVSGTVEDWGVAFEGLPLDSKLYPAVGLYQRDDRVTLLSVENLGASHASGTIEFSGGECFFPREKLPRDLPWVDSIKQVRRFNDILSWDGVQYAIGVLDRSVHALEENDLEDITVTNCLPALAAALCLLPPTVPVLSTRCALTLMPHLNRVIASMEQVLSKKKRTHEVFLHGVREGQWTIRATPSGNGGCEEYVVDLKNIMISTSTTGMEGTGVGTTGKSKNGVVKLYGCVKGSSFTFMEEWMDGKKKDDSQKLSTESDSSSCAVVARLSLDGKRFDGSYRNVQYGSAGKIFGYLSKDKETQISKAEITERNSDLEACEALLCSAQSHLMTLVGNDAAGDFTETTSNDFSSLKSAKQREALKGALMKPLLSRASLCSNASSLSAELSDIRTLFSPPTSTTTMEQENIFETLKNELLQADVTSRLIFDTEVREKVDSLDEVLAPVCGGFGSLRTLCSPAYGAARKEIISALLFHCGLQDAVIACSSPGSISATHREGLCTVWGAALRIMENGFRKAVSSNDGSRKFHCETLCDLYSQLSQFLVSLSICRKSACDLSAELIGTELSFLFELINAIDDIAYVKIQMLLASKRGIVRLLALREMHFLLESIDPNSILPIECLLVGLPQLLGRGKDVCPSFLQVALQQSNENRILYHEGSFLTRLSGSHDIIKNFLCDRVRGLFHYIGVIADCAITRRAETSLTTAHITTIDSVVLAILSTYVGNIRHGDVSDILSTGKLLTILPKLLNIHRDALLGTSLQTQKKENSSPLDTLQDMCQEDISRAILKANVSLAHLIIYQATIEGEMCRTEASSSIVPCLKLLRTELATVFQLIEPASVALHSDAINRRSEEDFRSWKKAEMQDTNSSGSMQTSRQMRIRSVGQSTCLEYLRFQQSFYGSLMSTVVQGSQQKLPVSTRASSAFSSARKVAETSSSVLGGFVNQYVSHWLHILSCVLKSEKAMACMMLDTEFREVLFDGIGLDVSLSKSEGTVSVCQKPRDLGVVPGRFRARLLRLILPLLSASEPCGLLVEAFFQLSGLSFGSLISTGDEDESLVSKEATSLLRHLHSPKEPLWRQMINSVIGSITAVEQNDSATMCKKVGVLSFFSGKLETVSRGSYVLLKPTAASSLTSENQSTPNAKSHSNGIGGSSLSAPAAGATPHHIVGNGTGSVIAGLCRAEAPAGIVSSVDLKTGLCEVILVTRCQSESSQKVGDMSGATVSSKKNGAMSGRHTLTVRALRAPLGDVVSALEVPLFLDESIPLSKITGSFLRSSIASLLSAVSSTQGDKSSKTTDFSYDLMVIRSCIVLLSDSKILSSFRKQGGHETFSKLLSLAWPDDSKAGENAAFVRALHKKGLSSIPSHEARFHYLSGMLKELNVRLEMLRNTPVEEQERKMELLTEGRDVMATAPQEDNIVPQTSKQSRPTSARNRTLTEIARDTDDQAGRAASQSTGGSNSEDEEETEAAATAAAHLREAAIAQMAELGLPRSWSELALRRTGGVDIEAAVTFCLERGPEIERMLAEEGDRGRRDASGGSNRRSYSQSNRLLQQLSEMGFPKRWCTEALAVTGNNVDEALTWILNNGERLSEEDEHIENESGAEGENADADDGDSADDEDETELDDIQSDEEVDIDDGSKQKVAEVESSAMKAYPPGWNGSIVPLRFISGRAIVDPERMEISGLPSGGFSSVGTKGVLLSTGKWYYEAILETAGCLQIGWADGSFAGHCHADRGDGCGDGPSSWAYDGWRRYRWHATATEWGCRWSEGDVVGCLVDMDNHIVSFTLNGEGESVGMGEAFSNEGFRPCGGVYACVSFNRREKLRLILGGSGSEPFKHKPPEGYCGVGEAVLNAVTERRNLLKKESVLESVPEARENEPPRFLCDFSDGEHGHELMAWAHRYYGSDASVHLGSGRPKQNASRSSSNSSSQFKNIPFLTRRLEKSWNEHACSSPLEKDATFDQISERLQIGYGKVQADVATELLKECIANAVMLSRKLILHVLITEGENFDANVFLDFDVAGNPTAPVQFWKVIEACTSLRNAGWVGEAGAMAVAAEALGLGISSNDSMQIRPSGERMGVISASDLDEGLVLAAGGVNQMLTCVLKPEASTAILDTGSLAPSSAEAAMGSDGGGGLLAFLQEGLQSAVVRSPNFRRVLVAAIRQSVRRLAVVEYEGDDFDTQVQEDEEFANSKEKSTSAAAHEQLIGGSDVEDCDLSHFPDARLTSFLTGLLLSKPVQDGISDSDILQRDLFEAWSVGLLSASLPWRMICAFTAAGILSTNPTILSYTLHETPTLCRFFGRLQSTVSRRIWAERAAVPVCSRYAQSLIELLTSVRRACARCSDLPDTFSHYWGKIEVDAATPLPLNDSIDRKLQASCKFWESSEAWISSDADWEIWTGIVDYEAVDWKIPSRSSVRTLMDSGDGPPLVREGSYVVRGTDWNKKLYANDDGKDVYDEEKAARDREKRMLQDLGKEKDSSKEEELPKSGTESFVSFDPADDSAVLDPTNESTATSPLEIADKQSTPPDSEATSSKETSTEADNKKKGRKKKLMPSPKLPIGTVLSIEPWNGIPGMARRVRWNLTGIEGVYRFGGDGGMYDLCHVQTNGRHTRIKKRHPLPESSEQCATRHGFGAKKSYNILLRQRKVGMRRVVNGVVEHVHEGILEWPDFGSAVRVRCTRQDNGTVVLEEDQLLFGSKDSGWTARFGQPSFVSGSTYRLSPIPCSLSPDGSRRDILSSTSALYEDLQGGYTFKVKHLRNPLDGSKLSVTSKMRFVRGQQIAAGTKALLPTATSPSPPPLTFDRQYHSESLSLSRDGRTISCISSDGGRGTAFASMGFTKGVHYWEVKLEQADIGSVFIGVAEKPHGSGSGSSFSHDSPVRLNRWHGWGFVNFRATYTSGAERVFGSHCHAGDTVGVLLDCDAGRLSFFFDGLKYGEHLLNDLGCAFENLSPFGYNVDGCGSGGAGQGAPSGFENGSSNRFPAQGTIRPRTLWPVIGLRNQGDRITMSAKWNTSYGVDGVVSLGNVVAVDEVLNAYTESFGRADSSKEIVFPNWFIEEAFDEYERWSKDEWTRSVTRGSGPFHLSSIGLDADFDASPMACATACASIGMEESLLAGDKVKLSRSAGRILELAEQAQVLGSFQGRLYYKIVSQKSEGGSLTEGGGRAWCWDESEVVGGLDFVTPGKGRGIKLPLLARFSSLPSNGLRVVYDNGAVLRSDLEIFEGSINLGTIPGGSILPREDVLERRVNSCGVVRFRVRFEKFGVGWISSRIRGGTEEPIVEPMQSTKDDDKDEAPLIQDPRECASIWYQEWLKTSPSPQNHIEALQIDSLDQFQTLLSQAVVKGRSVVESDSILVRLLNVVGNFSETGDAVECSFRQVASALSFAASTTNATNQGPIIDGASTAVYQASAAVFADFSELPSIRACLARVALLRSLNRRTRLALPWLSVRPCQEGSAILGGLFGHGTSPDRAGRTHVVGSEHSWIQVPSIATRLRSLRDILFTSVKRDFLRSITDATATPTPLSHDEYELPREIRTVRINRLKAGRAMLSNDRNAKRKYCVFAQLQSETKNWGGAGLRRGYVAKGHGGQKRAFKVKLIGEGVNDYSGPYREAFSDAISEVLKIDEETPVHGALGVLDPSPNNASSIGESRDLFMFSLNRRSPSNSNLANKPKKLESQACEGRIYKSFASLVTPRDELSREVEEALVFLGRLAGTAFRHGISLDLPLPLASVWNALTEQPVSSAQKLRELDYLAFRQLENDIDADDSTLLLWQKRMLNSFAEGLSNVLPVEILPLMTGAELRDTICGNPDVDVELLKQVVEYEGYSETDKVIEYFWETLHEMTNEDRKQFLQFVWARNRLPIREADFDAPFKIQKDSTNVENLSDKALPSASTCFFCLTLPNYSSRDILQEKLLFAIKNVTTMETDFQTNSAEIAEGYRAF